MIGPYLCLDQASKKLLGEPEYWTCSQKSYRGHSLLCDLQILFMNRVPAEGGFMKAIERKESNCTIFVSIFERDIEDVNVRTAARDTLRS